MKQIRFFAVMMMLTMSAVVMAQTTVKGVLKDKVLDEAEPFATVRVFKAGQTDSSQRKSTVRASSTSYSAVWARRTSARPSN